MNRYLLILTASVSFLAVSTTVAALTPEQIADVIDVVTADTPGALVLEIDMESRRDGGIVSAETNGGTEYYVALETMEILERERNLGGWGTARITDQILGDSRIRDLGHAYNAILEYLSQHEQYSRFESSDFYSIEYDIAFGRLIVEVSFEGSPGDLEIYFDPLTAVVLESEWDD